MFTFLFALFAVGTVGFYLMAAILFGLMVLVVEGEEVIRPSGILLCVIALMWLAYGLDPFRFVLDQKWWILAEIGGYFGIGILWVLVKWSFFTQRIVDRIVDRMRPRIESYRGLRWIVTVEPGVDRLYRAVEEIPPRFSPPEGGWKQIDSSDPRYYPALIEAIRWEIHEPFPPNPRKNKSRISYWIGFWPFSMFWWLMHKPIQYISEFIYARMLTTLVGLTNWIVKRNIREMQ